MKLQYNLINSESNVQDIIINQIDLDSDPTQNIASSSQ